MTASFTATSATAVQAKLSELRTLMRGHMDRKEEARALTLLRGTSAGELNQLFSAMSREEVHGYPPPPPPDASRLDELLSSALASVADATAS